MTDSLMTRGINCERCGKMMAGLLWVAELRVVKASRRLSKVVSLSIVLSIPTSMGFRTRSNSSSVSVKAKRMAWMTIPRTKGAGSWRYV